MRGQEEFVDVDEQLKELSAKGDDLERLKDVVNFKLFWADLDGDGRSSPRQRMAGEPRHAVQH